MIFMWGRRAFVHAFHVLHALHHRALRHGFLAHLHVVHHVLHHLLLHLCLSRIHGDPLLHHVGDDGGHQVNLLVLGRMVHFGDLFCKFRVLNLHVFLHFLFLFLHFLAVFHHFSLGHHLPLRRLGGLRLNRSPDGQGQGQCEAGTDEDVRMRLFFHVLLLFCWLLVFAVGVMPDSEFEDVLYSWLIPLL